MIDIICEWRSNSIQIYWCCNKQKYLFA